MKNRTTKKHYYFPIFAPEEYRCKTCGNRLQIWAFIDSNGKYVCPVLVCHWRTGCGNFFDLEAYNITIDNLCISKEEYDVIIGRKKKEENDEYVYIN